MVHPTSRSTWNSQGDAGAAAEAAYLQPADFAERNKRLITTITDLLGDQQDRFSQFRSLSAQFRTGSSRPKDYYGQCNDIMGRKCFHALFPELLVLLPVRGSSKTTNSFSVCVSDAILFVPSSRTLRSSSNC